MARALSEEELADPEVPALGRRNPNAPAPASSSFYIRLNRVWKDGDTVEVTLPKTLHIEPMPDNKRQVAILWGPLVLAGDLGPGTRWTLARSTGAYPGIRGR